jgi:hypothetical protein
MSLSCLLRLYHAATLRVLLAALVLPLGGLGRANDASQLQVICAIFASGTRRRSLLHVGKTRSAYTHAEFACASRGTPPALTWRPVCFVRAAWSSRQACGDREIVGLQFVEPAPYAHVPWHPANGCLTVVRVCTDASRMPACERSRTYTLRPLKTRVPICVPPRTTGTVHAPCMPACE